MKRFPPCAECVNHDRQQNRYTGSYAVWKGMTMSEPTVTYEQVVPLADELTRGDKVRLFEHLRLELEREYLARQPEASGYPPDFFERTYGILAADPIERPTQGDYEERDEIE